MINTLFLKIISPPGAYFKHYEVTDKSVCIRSKSFEETWIEYPKPYACELIELESKEPFRLDLLYGGETWTAMKVLGPNELQVTGCVSLGSTFRLSPTVEVLVVGLTSMMPDGNKYMCATDTMLRVDSPSMRIDPNNENAAWEEVTSTSSLQAAKDYGLELWTQELEAGADWRENVTVKDAFGVIRKYEVHARISIEANELKS